MIDFFISHRGEDAAWAEWIADVLIDDGFSVFLDTRDIRAGQSFPQRIASASDEKYARHLLCVFSPAYFEEPNFALDELKGRYAARSSFDASPIVPVVVRPCEIPALYRQIVRISITGLEEARAREKLLAGVRPLRVPGGAPNEEPSRGSKYPGIAITAKVHDDHERSRVLGFVEHHWLREHLPDAASMRLPLRPRLIETTRNLALMSDDTMRSPGRGVRELPPDTSVESLYAQGCRSLLVLGAAGSGKTTALLRAARVATESALEDPAAPVPVILGLSKWNADATTLESWLIDQLRVTYKLPQRDATSWVESDRCALFLDGLDEMAEAQRSRFVDALNDFVDRHHVRILVTARSGDYASLGDKLRFERCVEIQPIPDEQVDACLAAAGPELSNLRRVVAATPDFRRLASTPFMLGVIIRTYAGRTEDEIRADAADPSVLRDRILEAYLRDGFERKGRQLEGHRESDQRRLGYLAASMLEHGEPVFHAEVLQPNWVPQRMRSGYVFVERVVLAAVDFIALALPVGVFFGWMHRYGVDGFGACVGGFLGVLIGAFAGHGPIRTWTVVRWSFRQALQSLWIGLVVSGAFAILVFAAIHSFQPSVAGNATLVILIYSMLAWPLARGLATRPTSRPVRLGRGLRTTARNAVLVGTAATAFILVPCAYFTGLVNERYLIWGRFRLEPMIDALDDVALFAIGFGLFASNLAGFRTLVRHATIRAWLSVLGLLPWRDEAFLERGCRAMALERLGGGVRFVHRELQEFIARRWSDARFTNEGHAGPIARASVRAAAVVAVVGLGSIVIALLRDGAVARDRVLARMTTARFFAEFSSDAVIDEHGVLDTADRAIAFDPEYANAWRWKARQEILLRRMDSMVATARRAVELDPECSIGYEFLADAYACLADWEAAAIHLERALELDTIDRFAMKLRLVRYQLDRDPSVLEELKPIARRCGRVGEIDVWTFYHADPIASRAFLDACLDVDPADALSLMRSAVTWDLLGDGAAAERDARAALASSDASAWPEMRLDLAAMLERRGNYAEAVEAASGALEIGEFSAVAREITIACLRALGDGEGEERVLSRLLDVRAGDDAVVLQRAESRRHYRNFVGAMEDYSRLERRHPEDPTWRAARVMLAAESKDHAMWMREAESYCAEAPDDPKLYAYLGIGYAELGASEFMIDAFECLESVPDLKWVCRRQYAAACEKVGEWGRAVALYDDLIERSPAYATGESAPTTEYVRRGAIALMRGDLDAAREDIEYFLEQATANESGRLDRWFVSDFEPASIDDPQVIARWPSLEWRVVIDHVDDPDASPLEKRLWKVLRLVFAEDLDGARNALREE